jgi:hypothetical protein
MTMTREKRRPPVKIVDTPCGQLSANCSTCSHSFFIKADRHMCELKSTVVAGDSDCEHWLPLVLANGHCLFGLDHGEVQEC